MENDSVFLPRLRESTSSVRSRFSGTSIANVIGESVLPNIPTTSSIFEFSDLRRVAEVRSQVLHVKTDTQIKPVELVADLKLP